MFDDTKQREYMSKAIEVAKSTAQDGGVAIGAVIVDNSTGQIIACQGSLVGVTKDPTAHAEVNAIRAACQKINSEDLFGYSLFSTLEPCQMCLSAAAWAKIPNVYFGAYRRDVDSTLFDTKHSDGDESESSNMNLRETTDMHVVGGILEDECAELLSGYHEKPKHKKD